MLKLQFNLHHQDIYLVNRGEVVATDSKNYLVAHFNTITDDWETPLTAIFTDDKHKQPYAVIVGASEELEENECFVPWEVLTDECNVYVSVYCGNLHTTVTAAFKVRKSGYIDGETPPPPSPTVYTTIIQALQDLDSGKQDKLTAGTNITIDANGVISAKGGTDDYNALVNKPQINGVTVDGSKSNQDFGFSNFYYSPDYPPLYQSSSVNYQIHDIWIRTNPAPITTTNPFSQQIPYILQSIWNGNILIWEPLRVTVHISDDPYVITPPEYELEGSRVLKYRAGDLWMARSVYGSGTTTPRYNLQSLYICIGSKRQSKPPYNQFNITWFRIDNKNSQDYVLTEQDKQDIADIVIQRLQGGD